MPYNPNIHHRRSIRLKGYDYSQAGLYFITICVQNRACLFGEISTGKMMLNDAGKMVENWYHELENKFPDIKCHEYVVMPNHFHCIIENVSGDQRPISDQRPIYGPDNKKHNATVGDMVDWLKTMSTNEYIRGVKTLDWPRFDKKLWQRNYWEHIIRDERSYQTISEYIVNNPSKWKNDIFNNQ